MTTFADSFRELVTPDLRRSCRLQALAVARGRCSFSEAADAVWRQAVERGALYLPRLCIDDEWVDPDVEIQDWIATTISRTIADIDAREEAAMEIVDEALEPLEASWRTTA